MKNTLLISHTDLDGYASQFILYTLLDKSLHNFEFKNLNYDDLNNYLLELDYTKYDKVYITDLNIKLHTAEHIDIETSNVILIDHHTYDEAFNEFSWCNINTKYSAALNTFKYIDESTNTIINDNIRIFAELVSIYDLWKIEDEYFNTMTFISDVVYNCPMHYNKREFLFKYFSHLIYNEILYKSVYDVEMDYITFCYETFYTNKQLPTKQLCILSELDEFAKDIKTIYHSGIEIGIVSIPSSNFQYLSSEYLQNINSDCILININFKNNSGGVRSVNNKSIIISKLLGGGGHANAGGFSHTFKNMDEVVVFFMTLNIDLNKICI